MRARAVAVAVVVSTMLCAAGSTGGAQRPGRVPVVPVQGVVFDSVRGRPLGNATVTIDPGCSTTTDARGRFHFDSVPTGVRTISVQHATLDTLGLFGISRKASV